MKEVVYNDISHNIKDEFNSRDYVIMNKGFEQYFNKNGERDRRRKYFKILIRLSNLRRRDVSENTKIIGETLLKCTKVMSNMEEKYEELVFTGCVFYSNIDCIELRFCSVNEVALRQLTYSDTSFNV